MSISAIFLFIAFLAGVTVVVIWPLIQPDQSQDQVAQSAIARHRAQLQSEHEAIVLAVRDLDFDFQTGKLTPDDYREQRDGLMAHGVEILQQLDHSPSRVSVNESPLP